MAIFDAKDQVGTPANPPAGYLRLYPQGTSWKYVDELGVVRTLSTGISDEDVQDIVGAMFIDSASLDVTYNDAGNVVSAVIAPSVLATINSALQSGASHTVLSDVGTNTHAQIDSHIGSTANPHSVTKSQVGLGNVDNTSDLNKPISTATQNALNNKANSNISINSGTGLSGGGDLTASRTLNLDNTAVSAGSYTNTSLTVDAQGRITAASNGTAITPIFGSEFQEEESLALSSTTSTTFQNKLNLTTPSLPAGRYRISWSYSWSQNSSASDFLARIQLNDTTTIMNHAQEAQDPGLDQLHRNTGFEYQTLSGVQSIDLDYASEASGTTAWIQRARLEIWRVS